MKTYRPTVTEDGKFVKLVKENGKRKKLIFDTFEEYKKSFQPKKLGRFIPEFQEKYWYIHTDGDTISFQNDGHNVDKYNISTGNCYRTRKEAQEALEKQKALVQLNDLIDEANGDWVADWSILTQPRYSPHYDYKNKKITLLSWNFLKGNTHINPIKDTDLWTDEMARLFKIVNGVGQG